MKLDATYLTDPAAHLARAGQWDLALTLTSDPDDRAEYLTERFCWHLTGADEAIAAARAASPETSEMLLARISYWHRLVKLDNPLDLDELAIFDKRDTGWGAFWSGVVLDNVYEKPEEARKAYDLAYERLDGNLWLESFVIRHQAFHLLETDREQARALNRRSLAIRSSLGARPQIAAQQAALANSLPEDDPERAELLKLVHATAEELNLAWLKPAAE